MSSEAARRTLEAQGYFVFAVEGSAGTVSRHPFLRHRGGRVRLQALVVFNQELLALIKAGLPILTALDLLGERSQQPQLRIVLAEAREAVKGGMALSAALAQHPRIFSALYTGALEAGEQSGNLVDALSRYLEYQKRIVALRQRFRAALTYPAALALLSGAVIVFLLTFVVPTFTRIYGDMEAELPAATRILVGLTRQTVVFAFDNGDGFANILYPTNPFLMICLGLTVVSWPKWFRWTLPLQAITVVVCLIFMFFSRYTARRFRIVSRMPPTSPAATSDTYRVSKTFG